MFVWKRRKNEKEAEDGHFLKQQYFFTLVGGKCYRYVYSLELNA